MYSIRFPLVVEKTRCGRRILRRKVVDKTGLHGARACAAGMVTVAMSYRDQAPYRFAPELTRRLARLQMRQAALWARLFAGQICDADPRLGAVEAQIRPLVQQILRPAA